VNRIGASRLQHLSQILQVPIPFSSTAHRSCHRRQTNLRPTSIISSADARSAGLASQGSEDVGGCFVIRMLRGPRDKRLSKCAGTGGRSLSMARYPARDTQYAAAVIAPCFYHANPNAAVFVGNPGLLKGCLNPNQSQTTSCKR
jgi:hypothetical protein